MDFIDEAVRLNREGAILMASGELKRSMQAFRQSLRLLAEGAHPSNEAALLSRVGNPIESVGLLSVPVEIPALFKLVGASGCDSEERQSPPDALYRKALVFDLTNMILSPHCLAFCTAVTEFNMALTLQLRSMLIGGEKTLQMARRLYGCCMNHLKFCNGHHPESYSVLVAALNNQAIISIDLCDVPSLQLELEAIVVAVNACQMEPNTAPLYNEVEYQSFLLNAIIFRNIQVSPAA